MKVCPNQLVGASMWADGAANPATGIPLRLHIAAQSFPVRWSTEAIQTLANGAVCTIPEAVRKAADCELNIADLLIAAHNETCDREGDL